MIEILDIRDAELDKLDITPEMMRAAYNVLRQGCKQHIGCVDCSLLYIDHGGCPIDNWPPSLWPDLEVPDGI